MEKQGLIKNVIESNSIKMTFYHIGTPTWTSEIWDHENGVYKCIHEEASNSNVDASNDILSNDEMYKFIRRWKSTDCIIEFN